MDMEQTSLSYALEAAVQEKLNTLGAAADPPCAPITWYLTARHQGGMYGLMGAVSEETHGAVEVEQRWVAFLGLRLDPIPAEHDAPSYAGNVDAIDVRVYRVSGPEPYADGYPTV
jgi:hypothetical protein